MTALQPVLDSLEPWAEPLIAQTLKGRGADAADYRREVRGDAESYMVILTHKSTKPGARGGGGEMPDYEIVLDRRAKAVRRVQAVR